MCLNVVMIVLLAAAVLYFLGVALLQFLGQGKLPVPPERTEKMRFAVLICARNEERVLPGLLESLARQDYPKQCCTVFVVAHNCTDGTAETARRCGAVCWEHNAPSERRKGHALRYGIGRIRQEYPGRFDGVVLFDADNLADPGFLRAANNALHAGADAIQGYRMTKNPTGVTARLGGLLWLQVMRSETLPHTKLGLPAMASGTGMAISMEALPEEGWYTETLVEDVDFSIRLALGGRRMMAAPEARFYDEQPNQLRQALMQRWRWMNGWNMCIRQNFGRVCRSLGTVKHGWKLLFDLLLNPAMCCMEAGVLLALIAMLRGSLSPRWLLAGVAAYLFLLSAPVSVCRKDGLSLREWGSAVLLFPLWLSVSCLFSIPTLFVRNAKWRPQPHTDQRRLEDIQRE